MFDVLYQSLSSRGFLGTGAPLFSDLVVIAMLVLVPWFMVATKYAKTGRRQLHAVFMVSGWGLLVAVISIFIAWNLDRRVASEEIGGALMALLCFHVPIAVMTLILAVPVVVTALLSARYDSDRGPTLSASFAQRHRFVGRTTLGFFVVTAATGILVYYLRYFR